MDKLGPTETEMALSLKLGQEPARPWSLQARPGYLMRRLHQIHVSLFFEHCGTFRITPLQYSLLSLLAERGESDQTTLANSVALDRTTTTGALKRLEARGFIKRAASPTDRRAQSCRPTQAGCQLLDLMEEAAREAHDATLEPLADDERETLMRLMRKITAAHQQRQGNDGVVI